MSYPPPVPRTTFQGHSVEGNMKVDDVHANIFQGQKVSGHRSTGFKCSGIQTIQRRMETGVAGGVLPSACAKDNFPGTQC